MATGRRILVYDSDEQTRRLIRDVAERLGFEVVATGDGREGIEFGVKEAFYLAIVEINAHDLDGLEIYTRVKGQAPFVPVLLISRDINPPESFGTYLRNADGRLVKPLDARELELHIQALVRARTSFDRIVEQQSGGPGHSVVDCLTGLYNRQFVNCRLQDEINRAARYALPLTLLVIDIDDFREINHRFGFTAGDAVLKQLSEILRVSLRQVDTVCRYGGEEYIAILPHTDGIGAVIAAERLKANVARHTFELEPSPPRLPDERELHLTVSIGIAEHSDSTKTPEDLIALADEAVLVAKQRGKNCVILGGH